MNIHLILLIVYSIGVIAFGLWTSRFVRGSRDFFVAGRSLGPGLILSSMLAANIGAGSTVGVAGLAYRDGISAWWWVGSAGLASFVFAYLDRAATVADRSRAQFLHDRRLSRIPVRRERPCSRGHRDLYRVARAARRAS